MKGKKHDFSKIKLFLSDVDGVLTDAGMYYTENGDEFKKFCTYDGMGFHLLQKTGVKVGILTTEDRQLNRRRAKKLSLDFDFHGVKDKLQIVKDLCKKVNVSLDAKTWRIASVNFCNKAASSSAYKGAVVPPAFAKLAYFDVLE
mgnify:CR=1 FL=1